MLNKPITLFNIFKKDKIKLISIILLTGVSSGILSYVFHFGISSIKKLIHTDTSFTFTTFIWASILACLSLFLTNKFFQDTSGSGIPHVKLSLLALKGKLSRRLPFSKFLTSFLSLASGLSLGKEGPSVTISAAIAHLYSSIFGVSNELKKLLVTAGASAGLAAAFNTPIAAVVFTLEEIAENLNTKTLGVIIFTSIIASFTSYELLGNHNTFVTVHYASSQKWHLGLYLLLGVFMAGFGPLWIKLVISIRRRKAKFPRLKYGYLIFTLALAGLASHYSPYVLGDGVEMINNILGGQNFQILFLLSLFGIKFLLSAMSYSTGVSGGLFMPVLFVGAIGGGLFATILTNYFHVEGIEVGAFALIGMAAFLVSVIRVPFTAFVMLFEMTRDYELILPLMAASVSAYVISQYLMKGSVYELIAREEGVIMPEGDERLILDELIVENCMTKDIETLDATKTPEDVIDFLSTSKHSGFPVLNECKIIGIISRSELIKHQQDDEKKILSIGSISSKDLVTIYPDQSLLMAFDKMKKFHVHRIAVVSRFDKHRLVGILTAEDIVAHFGYHINDNE